MLDRLNTLGKELIEPNYFKDLLPGTGRKATVSFQENPLGLPSPIEMINLEKNKSLAIALQDNEGV